jgi:hypothetical protein
MTASSEANFKHNYQSHLKHLKLKGLQPVGCGEERTASLGLFPYAKR